jgi:hypothetical protein
MWQREGTGSGLTRADIMDMEYVEISEWAKLLTKALDNQAGGQDPEK